MSSNARTLADLVSTGGELADGQITVSEISDLTATAAELNTLDGITANVTELNYMDGATSSIQDQLDNISVTSGSLTKTFANGEQASITLSGAISPAPVVSVTKEVAQTGVSSKGGWDVATDGSNYELHDTAYDTTLTPGTIGFNIADASYDSVSFSVASQESIPQGLAFNNDGTKMYIAGASGDDVNQYSLSTAFDLSTASFDSVTFSIASQDTIVSFVLFNDDGTKMYSGGYNTNTVYEYDLSTAYDISTASYNSVSFSVASQENSLRDIRFNNDGTKMYAVGSGTDTVYQYTLSTAYDISTASYDSVSFDVSSQEAVPTGISFNNDGTKMYIIGSGGDEVNQYTLSTAFDLSTASFDSVTFSVSGQETDLTGITFNNDGTKMYVVGVSTDAVYQYTLSTGFDLSTASYDSVSFSVASQETGPHDIVFNNDGTKMYIVGSNTDAVYQYTLSTAYDISTASYDSETFDISSQELTSSGMVFNNDGTKMYVLGDTTDTVYQYTTTGLGYTTSETWVDATTNDELYALQEALTEQQFNRMNSTQLDAVTDPNHYTLGDTLDLAIMLYTDSAGSIPESDGVTINYDAEALNQGAVVGTDYDFDFPDSTTVRITSNAAQNLKIRVV